MRKQAYDTKLRKNFTLSNKKIKSAYQRHEMLFFRDRNFQPMQDYRVHNVDLLLNDQAFLRL